MISTPYRSRSSSFLLSRTLNVIILNRKRPLYVRSEVDVGVVIIVMIQVSSLPNAD